MDLEVPNALPTMLCRPPTINGTALAVKNLAAVQAMPGITDVAIIPHTPFVAGGVAVRGKTFGQCIDAVRALDVTWGKGSVDGMSEADVLAELQEDRAAAARRRSRSPRRSSAPSPSTSARGDPLETNCAVADVRSGGAEIWSCLKSPIWAQEQIAAMLGLTVDKVTVHVTEGGGSFGRHLFSDAAFEAAAVSKALGKPVKLMWHRTDNFRQGRVHPMCTSRVRATYLGGNVVAFDHRHTSVATDFSMGFGEILSATAATLPGANSLGYSELVFNLSQKVPYNFGVVTQTLTEAYAYNTFNTGSVRNIYSPDVTTAREVTIDQLAKAMGQDAYQFRRSFVRDDRMKAVLDAVAKAGSWGRSMPAGTAQGIAIHDEYKGRAACLVEIDCRPQTVGRKVEDAYTGPRVTKVVIAIDVGLPINPLRPGGPDDGRGRWTGSRRRSPTACTSRTATSSRAAGTTRSTRGSGTSRSTCRSSSCRRRAATPAAPGEFAVAPSMAATACAYARATGTVPTSFPINHDGPLGFDAAADHRRRSRNRRPTASSKAH